MDVLVPVNHGSGMNRVAKGSIAWVISLSCSSSRPLLSSLGLVVDIHSLSLLGISRVPDTFGLLIMSTSKGSIHSMTAEGALREGEGGEVFACRYHDSPDGSTRTKDKETKTIVL